VSGPILQVRGLKVSRGGVSVLQIPDLSILAEDFLSLIGPNGTGKSTLLLSLAGLLKREAGEIRFRGSPVENGAGLLDYRRRLAMVFQEPLLFDATVYDNVASGLKIRGVRRSVIRPKVEETLALFRVAHLASRSARKISGGEAQRTSLARAFATDPELILLDEPFASLDPAAKESIIEDLSHAMRTRGTTVIMATHDRMDALRLSNRIAVMDRGGIAQIGTSDEILHKPVNEAVASFVGVETILEGRVKGSAEGVLAVDVGGREVFCSGAFGAGEQVLCFIRPEHVTLHPARHRPDSSARNNLSGTVTRVQPIGLLYRVNIDCGFPLSAHVTAQAVEELGLAEGAGVTAAFKATSVHVIQGPRPRNPE
jgi:tungstate transport system ATP-binding protein